MKKIFTLITAALATVSAWAASPEFLFQEKPTVEGTTYEAPYKVDDMGFMKVYEQPAYLSLKGEKGREITLEVNATEVVSVCGLTGVCTQNTSELRKGTLEEASQYIQAEDGNIITADMAIHRDAGMDFDGTFDPTKDIPSVTLDVKAWYTDAPEEVATIKVILTNKSADELAGINDVTADGSASITFTAGNVLNYSVEQPAKLEIYTVNGALVLSRKIASVGSISLDALTPGVYVYSAAGQTGKILVK